MGVNRLSSGMIDMEKISEASKYEICFYWFRYREEFRRGLTKKITLTKMKKIMDELESQFNETKMVW